MRKFHNFTGSKFDLRIKWITRKTKTLLKLMDKCVHPACKIYHGVCSCGETYIGETIRHVETRWNEQKIPSEKSNPSKHMNSNITRHFSWSVIFNAPVKKLTRKILEVYFIALLKPTLNDQIESDLFTSLRMELRNCNVNEIVNIPQRHFILTLYILAFPILFI